MKKLILVFVMLLVCSISHAASLKWDAPEGVVNGYIVLWTDNVVSTSWVDDVGLVTEVDLNTFNLSYDTTYYFTVQAYNNKGLSGISNVVEYTTPAYAPTENLKLPVDPGIDPLTVILNSSL